MLSCAFIFFIFILFKMIHNDNYEDDEIWDDEEEFFYNDKINNKYYLGINCIYDNNILLSSSLSVNSFFKYDLNRILYYLYYSSTLRYSRHVIDIMKLSISPYGEYNVIIKSYWLRLLQRHIKKFYIEKYKILLKRGHPSSQRHFEIYGKYPYELRLPSLHGLLSCYKK